MNDRKLKSRRSSILKPPKPRNPLSDVDLNPPTDITIKSRRVSFHNVHFKKEFSSDPETNTIWHNSYEEEMNKSDFSDGKSIQAVVCNNEDMNRSIVCHVPNDEVDVNMSVQDMSIDSDIFNRTQLGNLLPVDEPEPTASTLVKQTEICTNIKSSRRRQTVNFIQDSEDANMEMTTVIPVEILSNKRKTILHNQMSEVEQNMEVTQNICPSLIQTIKTNRQNITENFTPNLNDNRKTIYFQHGNMDVTENIPINLHQKMPKNDHNIIQNVHEINMEITENIDTKIRQNKQRNTIFFSDMQEDEQNMEITQNICPNLLHNTKQFAEQIVENKENIYTTNSVIEEQRVIKHIHTESKKDRHTVYYNESISDITESVPFISIAKQTLSSENKQITQAGIQKGRQTIHCNESITDITENVPYISIKNQKVPSENKENAASVYETKKEQIINLIENSRTDIQNKEKLKGRQTIHFNETILDITESIPHFPIKKHKLHFEDKENASVYQTKSVSQYEAKEEEQNIEIGNIHSDVQNNEKIKGRQTIHFNETISDITENIPYISIKNQKVPAENKENAASVYETKKEQIINLIENSRTDIQNKEKLKGRQTMHFNETILDITESIPHFPIKKHKLHFEDKEYASVYQTKSVSQYEAKEEQQNIEIGNIHADVQNIEKIKGRQTIHFNETISDITENIPYISIKNQKIPSENKENACSVYETKIVSQNETKRQEQVINLIENSRTDIPNKDKLKGRQTTHFNETIMDITESIPHIPIKEHKLHSEHKENASSVYHTKTISQYEAQEEEQNIEIRNIHADVQNNEKIKGRQTIHFNETISDITENIPYIPITKQKLHFEYKENASVYQTKSVSQYEIKKEKNIEIGNINADVQNNEKIKGRQTIHFNESITDITENIPYIAITKQKTLENKEHTCSVYETKKVSQNTTNREEQIINLIENSRTDIPNKEKLKGRQTIHFNETIMDITESIPHIPIKKHKLHSEHKENVSVYQTTTVSQYEAKEEEQNMEIGNINADVQNNEKIKGRQTIHLNESITDITESVPYISIKNQKIPSENMENACSGYVTKKVSQNTINREEQITNLIENSQMDIQNKEKLKGRQTIHYNETISDITESIPHIPIKKHKLYSEHKEKESSVCQMITVSQYEAKEEEQNIEIGNIHANMQSNEKIKGRHTIHINESITDITESVPYISIKNQKNPFENKENAFSAYETKTVSQNETKREEHIVKLLENSRTDIPNKEKFKGRQTIHFNETISDITESIPNIPMKKQKLHSEHEENVSFVYQTKTVPQHEAKEEEEQDIEIQNKQKSKERQTMYFNGTNFETMDITKSVPLHLVQKLSNRNFVDKENMYSNFQQNVDNMEITQNIPSVIQNQKLKTSQTIHFNQSNMGNMEITENVPSNLVQKMIKLLPSENKEQTINQNDSTNFVQHIEKLDNTKSNSISHCRNMDITESNPINFMQKSHHQETLLQGINNVDITENTGFFSNSEGLKINFNESNIEKIDITENIPTIVKEIDDNHQNISSLQNQDNQEFKEKTYVVELENRQPNLEQEIINIGNDDTRTDNQNRNEQIEIEQKYTDFIPENIQSDCNESKIDNMEITENVPANLLQKIIRQSFLKRQENVEQNENPINVSEALNLTPIHNQRSFNITANLTSLVDSTEKLINYQIGLPASDYSKIITEEIDKNYSIVNTSIPDNLDFSDMSISDSGQKMDSIISVNSSTDSIEHVDEWKKMLNKVKPPPELIYSDLDVIAKVPDDKLFQSLTPIVLNVKEKIKKNLIHTLEMYKKKPIEITCNIPQKELEEERPNIVFEKIKKLLEKQQQRHEIQKELTLTDKIKRISTNDKLWSLIPNTEYSFIFMKNIKFDLQIDPNSEIVHSVHSTLNETKLSPIGKFVFERLKPQLREEKIKSSLGNNYTIFSFLDYLTQVSEDCMDNTINELCDLTLKYGLRVDENLNATLLFTNTSLLLGFEIIFNLNDLDQMRADLIKVNQLVCTVDEKALKRLVKFCPSGIQFIRKYHQSVSDYLKLMQKSKVN